MIKTIFAVNVHHPAKKRQRVTEIVSAPGYGQEAANSIDEYYERAGKKVTKVLQGFEIDGVFKAIDLTAN
jgi:hypothetical protein